MMKNPAYTHQALASHRPVAASRPVCGAFLCGAFLCLALCMPPLVAMAQTASVSSSRIAATEERIKGVFLYKFLSYVEWPLRAFARDDAPYIIGIMNADNIADELSKISAGRKLNGRAVIIKKLRAEDSLNEIHVLFIGGPQTDRMRQSIKQAQRQPLLVVTEASDALAQGSMINFRVVDDRVRFEISVEAAEKAGLKISSRLLAIAISVKKGPEQ